MSTQLEFSRKHSYVKINRFISKNIEIITCKISKFVDSHVPACASSFVFSIVFLNHFKILGEDCHTLMIVSWGFVLLSMFSNKFVKSCSSFQIGGRTSHSKGKNNGDCLHLCSVSVRLLISRYLIMLLYLANINVINVIFTDLFNLRFQFTYLCVT